MLDQVRLKDVAEVTGFSLSTVSDALRGHGRISPATRKKISAAAKELGYRPNLAATFLASAHEKKPATPYSVALISHLPSQMIASRHRAANLDMVAARATELGYCFEHFEYKLHSMEPSSFRNMIYTRGFQGLIFHDLRDAARNLLAEDWNDFSVVCLGRTRHRPAFCTVRNNPFEMVCRAWQEVRSKGYKKIGMMVHRHAPEMLDDKERCGAAYACLHELRPDEVAIPPCECRHDDADNVSLWINRHQPDAVIAFHDGWYWKLQEMGFSIPQDFAFASLHLNDSRGLVAGVVTNEGAITKICVDQLDTLIRHHHRGKPPVAHETLVSGTWMDGLSLP